jgi:cobalt-precorrin 5A hydrolase
MIAAGVGCKRGCASDDVLRALEAALASAGRVLSDVQALYAPEFKAEEPGLSAAAHQLGKPLRLLTMADLQLQAAHALTHTEHVSARFGVPSIAETAALAGACTREDPRARLLGPRQVAGGASCALAIAAPTREGAT